MLGLQLQAKNLRRVHVGFTAVDEWPYSSRMVRLCCFARARPNHVCQPLSPQLIRPMVVHELLLLLLHLSDTKIQQQYAVVRFTSEIARVDFFPLVRKNIPALVYSHKERGNTCLIEARNSPREGRLGSTVLLYVPYSTTTTTRYFSLLVW